MKIELTLPIYIEQKKKDVLVGMNAFRNLHHYTKNKWKQHYHELVYQQLSTDLIEKYDGFYKATYTLYYKNPLCDNPNVCSLIDKFAIDALVSYGVMRNDNVKRYIDTHYKVGGMDKENPRVEVVVETLGN